MVCQSLCFVSDTTPASEGRNDSKQSKKGSLQIQLTGFQFNNNSGTKAAFPGIPFLTPAGVWLKTPSDQHEINKIF